MVPEVSFYELGFKEEKHRYKPHCLIGDRSFSIDYWLLCLVGSCCYLATVLSCQLTSYPAKHSYLRAGSHVRRPTLLSGQCCSPVSAFEVGGGEE